MSDFANWRIGVSEQSAPIALASQSLTRGGMVINAIRGNAEPVLLTKGENEKLFRLFGYPSASFPHVQEAYDYLQDSDLWVSAPSNTTSALVGGVLVTKSGSIPMTRGVEDVELFNFSLTPWEEEVGVGDGVETNFVYTLTAPNYVNQSISKLIIGSTEIDVTASDAEPEVLTGTGITTGTLTRGTLSLDVTLDTPPALGESIKVVYQTDYSEEAYFALFSASPSTNIESIKTSYNSDLGQFEFDFYMSDFRSRNQLVDTYVGSNIPSTFNASNENIFIESFLEDVPYFHPKANTSLAYDSFTDDLSLVSFGGGFRDTTTFTSSEIAEGWAFFQSANTYPTDIFMDVTADSSVPSIFNDLRNNYQKYKRYILPLPDGEDASTSISTKTAYSIDNRGLSFYSNWVFRRENYTSTKFWSPAIGVTGINHAKIIREAFGGLAPAGTNENGLGGQITLSVEKVRYDYSDTDLRNLDDAGINARVFDTTYGLIIASQKTAQNPNVLTDFSYIGHSGCADYIISNVIRQVLVQQVVKLNDPSHRTIATAKGESIVDPVQGRGLLRDYIVKCDEENNDDAVLARKEFKYAVGVKFTPFSERILLNFVAVDQRVSVEEGLFS